MRPYLSCRRTSNASCSASPMKLKDRTASITVAAGVNVSGNVLALTGGVTMDTNNVSVCNTNVNGAPAETRNVESGARKAGMSSFPDSPNILKAGLVLLDPGSFAILPNGIGSGVTT